MPTFIGSCNCNGMQPIGIISGRHHLRSDIIARLIRERNVARVIIAPGGFGKSVVAYEYAQVVFGFAHVFWVDCASPCFIRDLDKGHLATGILAEDAEAQLVVCDDIPHLDSHRSELLSSFVDELLSQGCEVILTCTPAADTFSQMQSDGIILRGSDLLLSDTEIAAEELRGSPSITVGEPVPLCKRIPCLHWADHGLERLLGGIQGEDLPAEMKLTMIVLLILNQGTFDDLRQFIVPDHLDEVVRYLGDNYAYLGIDRRSRTFQTIEASIPELGQRACLDLDKLADASPFDARVDLCFALGDFLLGRSAFQRAVSVIITFVSRGEAATWLKDAAWSLLGSLQALPFMEAYDYARRGAPDSVRCAQGAALWALRLLGDESSSSRRAVQLATDETAAWEDRACGMLEALHLGGGVSEPSLDAILDALDREGRAGFAWTTGNGSGHLLDWAVGIRLQGALHKGLSEFSAAWEEMMTPEEGRIHGSHTSRNALLVFGSRIFEAALVGKEFIAPSPKERTAEGAVPAQLIEHTRRSESLMEEATEQMLQLMKEDESLPLLVLHQCLPFFLRADERYPHLAIARRLAVHESRLNKAALELIEQTKEYRRQISSRTWMRNEYKRTHPDPFRRRSMDEDAFAVVPAAPKLEIDLFGSLDIRIDGKLMDPKRLSRKKVKIILAVLVMGKGREIPKERLINILWPEFDLERGKRNLYSVWSQLKKALTIDGTCPYLISTHTGCKLDCHLVSSDFYGFDDLCRSLMFGSEEPALWERLYSRVIEEYSDDLLADEAASPYIAAVRERCRTQLVDALISASNRLNASHEPNGALWFAREALRRDGKREDAYIALMEAQIASNQRGPALETYFQCRRYLSEELGIDPSLKVLELYRSIIESEEVFL